MLGTIFSQTINIDNKKRYRNYCLSISELPFYYRDWWLDAVCGAENWDVALYLLDNKISAALPYFVQNKFGFRLIRQAILTPYQGVWINYPHNIKKTSSKRSFEKKVINSLIKQLGSFDYFNQNFHLRFPNFQPFIWQGYDAFQHYNFILDLTKSTEELYEGLSGKVRTPIKKASAKLSFGQYEDLEDIYRLLQLTFSHTDSAMGFDKTQLSDVVSSLIKKDKCAMHYVKANGMTYAAALLVLDQDKIYSLLICSDPEFRSTGAVQYLIWEIIKNYQGSYQQLDFCGTMIERVEPIFRSFGAELVPYCRVSKKDTTKWKIASAIKSLWS